ncbi:hypothetical protein [Maribacter sp. LLG6340-A2]|uniref:hypothetical protein n=1 Tax=Maribacter sp. LLG6340-A2 TaxID=3160834 RepID=UPI00386D0566
MRQILYAIVVTFCLTSCSSSKQISVDNTGSSTGKVTNNTTQSETPEPSTTGENSTNTPSHLNVSAAAQANGSTGAMNNQMAKSNAKDGIANDQSMFTTLNMTNDQIKSYNAAMKRFKEQQKNRASGEIMGSIESERSRQLKDILTQEQYEMYKKIERSGN